MLPEDNTAKEMKWWKDKAFIDELDERYEAWQNDNEKAITLEEINVAIETLKEARHNIQ